MCDFAQKLCDFAQKYPEKGHFIFISFYILSIYNLRHMI
jgi:hypothetical protein